MVELMEEKNLGGGRAWRSCQMAKPRGVQEMEEEW